MQTERRVYEKDLGQHVDKTTIQGNAANLELEHLKSSLKTLPLAGVA